MRVLVTGGAGFIGGNLCVALAERHPGWTVTALDNLMRRGSELNLGRLRDAGVEFVHGDIRQPADLAALPDFDVMIECSAEPSVLAGLDDPSYSVDTNLVGAFHCLEAARRREAEVVFLSTSRVYPMAPIRSLEIVEQDTRFGLAPDQAIPGASDRGISEEFPLDGARSVYGATKLAAELLITEYVESFGMRAVVNRCGVIAGPWQMGKVDQGVFSWWLLAHLFGLPLSYIGYGGTGKQVRDLLHVLDLVDLIEEQIQDVGAWTGRTVNVGGGLEGSLSLLETTEICRNLTGTTVEIGAEPEERPGDVPVYISDCALLESMTSWRPRRSPQEVLADLFEWARRHEPELRASLGFPASGSRA